MCRPEHPGALRAARLARRLGPAALAALLLASTGAGPAPASPELERDASSARHITPTVHLLSKADAIRRELPEAEQFFLKEVQIGKPDFEAVKSRTGWAPDRRTFPFYVGRDASGSLAGTVEFVLVDTQHGPIEISMAFDPQGAVSQVMVITATVETVPWVRAVERSRMLEAYVGLPSDGRPAALAHVSPDAIGAMPYFVARVIDQAVARGLALYDALERTEAAGA